MSEIFKARDIILLDRLLPKDVIKLWASSNRPMRFEDKVFLRRLKAELRVMFGDDVEYSITIPVN